jgi:hypothetical protein
MKYKMIYPLLILLALFFSLSGYAQDTGVTRTARLAWSPINGASYYLIEIKKDDQIIISHKTTESHYEAVLTHGVYKFRISVFDQKKIIASRTSWRTLVIKSMSIVQEKYQYVALGWSYITVLPSWNELILNTNRNISLYYGYDLPQINGMAVEGIFEWEGFPNRAQNDEVERAISAWSLAPGISLYNRMNKYVTAAFHFDVGLALSRLDVNDRGQENSYYSVDPLTLLGFGLRGEYSYGFIEHGIEFKQIWYSGSGLFELRPYIRAGARF